MGIGHGDWSRGWSWALVMGIDHGHWSWALVMGIGHGHWSWGLVMGIVEEHYVICYAG